MVLLLYCASVAFVAINIVLLAHSSGLFGGLFHTSPLTQSFYIFLYCTSLTVIQ